MGRAQGKANVSIQLPQGVYRFCRQYAVMQGLSVERYLVWAIESDTMQTIKNLSSEEIAVLLGVRTKEDLNQNHPSPAES